MDGTGPTDNAANGAPGPTSARVARSPLDNPGEPRARRGPVPRVAHAAHSARATGKPGGSVWVPRASLVGSTEPGVPGSTEVRHPGGPWRWICLPAPRVDLFARPLTREQHLVAGLHRRVQLPVQPPGNHAQWWPVALHVEATHAWRLEPVEREDGGPRGSARSVVHRFKRWAWAPRHRCTRARPCKDSLLTSIRPQLAEPAPRRPARGVACGARRAVRQSAAAGASTCGGSKSKPTPPADRGRRQDAPGG